MGMTIVYVVVSLVSLHCLFFSSRPLFDGLAGTGFLVSIPKVGLEGHFTLSRACR